MRTHTAIAIVVALFAMLALVVQCDEKSPRPNHESKTKILDRIMERVRKLNDDEIPSVNDDDESSSKIDSARVWDMYRSELLKFLARGNKRKLDTLQLVTSPIAAEWAYNDAMFQAFANNEPRASSEWTFRSGRTFTDAYYDFLTSINVPSSSVDPASAALLERYQEEEGFLEQDYMKERMACFDQYSKRPDMDPSKFEEYESQYCRNVQLTKDDLDYVRAQAFVAARRSLGSEKNYVGRRSLGKFIEVPEDQRRFIEINPLSKFVERNRQGLFNAFDFQVTRNSKFEEGQTKWKSFSLSIGLPGFFSLGYGSQKRSMKMTTRLEDFQMRFGAQSWTAIRVVPDSSWFSGEAIQHWNRGPYRSGKTFETFFGKSGKLSLLPRTFYVVYKPWIELLLSRDDADQFAKASSSGLQLAIGPVQFSFSQAKTTSERKEENNLVRYRLVGREETPQLIAVDFTPLP